MTDLIGDQRWSDRLTYDGTWENNIFNFLRMVMPRLTRDLPRPFKMEGVERDDDSLQHKAVREAFTNSIIHSDFMLDGVLKVEKLDNEFVFTNSGLLKLPVEQIYHGGVSKARNKRMQNMLRMIGYGENMGSGFPLIVHAWDENHWVKPELSEQSQLLQVQLKLHVLKNVPVNVPINVQKDVQKDVQKQLTDRQKVILKMIAFDGCISYEEMSKKIDASAKTIQREVDILRKMGYVAREGGRKNGEWIILKK